MNSVSCARVRGWPGAMVLGISSGRYATRIHLFGLAGAVVVPLILFAALLIYRYAITEQARVERQSIRIAAQAGRLAEAELSILAAKLEGLASSSALARNDIAAFHAEAAMITAGREETIILRDFGVRQLLNSGLPFGASLPDGPPFGEDERTSFAAGRPHFSDVYFSPRNREPRIVVAYPILRDGQPRYVLGITMPTARIRDALIASVPPGYVVAVGDRKGVFVARSERHDEFTGKPGLPEYVQKVVGKQGSFRSRNFAGEQLLAGYYRSAMSGWFFTANIPVKTLERPLNTSLLQLAAFGVAALVASALLAHLFSRTIISATQGLAERAHRIGEGQAVAPLQTRLREFALIGEALVGAGDAIAARLHEQARARERDALLASIFDAAGIHVGVIDRESDGFRVVVANRAASAMLGRPGAPEETADVRSELDEARLAPLMRLFRQAIDGAAPVTAEFSLSSSSGESRTYIGTFTALATEPHARVAFTAMDITDRKRADVHRQLLVNELNHRVKNSLAIAQSIALQTLRSAPSMRDARTALSERLVSLARTHDVLTRENWEGASVQDIVSHIVETFGAADRVKVCGPSVRLLPGPALTLSLLLHELVTNAAKYGALRSDQGTIAIEWRTVSPGAAPRLVLAYAEQHGPAVAAPERKGFGTRLIAESFSSPDEGSIVIEYPPDGVRCRIEMTGLA